MTPPVQPLVRSLRGVVACGHPLAATAAIEILRQGGTAADAAVAAGATLAVVLPDSCGLGGDAMILVRDATGSHHAINGSGAAPKRLLLPLPKDGARTAAVPGLVAALEIACSRFGRIGLDEALRPAAALAAEGFPLGDRLKEAVAKHRARLEIGATEWELLGAALAPGAKVRLRPLGTLLNRIRLEGSSAFYEGSIAAAIAQAAAADGAGLSEEDLAAHVTVEGTAVSERFGGLSIHVQPPVSQAALVLAALQTVDRFEPRDAAGRAHLSIEALEAAFQFRESIAETGAVERLLSTDLNVDPQRARRLGGPRGYSHTTAVATADRDGMVVAMLLSVFDDFGSARLVPEGGFLLNDRLLGFSGDPNSPNAPAPGRRPIHTLSPVIVGDERRSFALATPGADGQVQFLVQVIADLRRGTGIPEALAAPRWRSSDQQLEVEEGFDTQVGTDLKKRGHRLRWLPAGDATFGAMVAAGIDLGTGSLFAAVDHRREAATAAL